MKLFTAIAAVCLSASAMAQGVRYDHRVATIASNYPPGAEVPVMAIPASTVTICTDGNCLLAPAHIFSNQGLTTQTANPMKADLQGNFGFWAAPGNYFYKVVAPTGTVLGIFPITLGGGGIAPEGISIEHNGTLVPIQNILNFDDTVPAPPAGNESVTFQTDGTGKVSAYVPEPTILGGLQMQVIPPVAGQFVIIYPTTIAASGSGSVTGVSNTSLTGVPYCTFGGAGSINTSGYALPSFVNPANVTAVYAFAISANFPLSGSGTCFSSQMTPQSFVVTINAFAAGASPTASIVPPASSDGGWGLAQATQPFSVTGANISTTTINASADVSTDFKLGSEFDMPTVGLIVYYTGSAPPANTDVQIIPPLNFAQNTLSINPTASFPGQYLLPWTVATARVLATSSLPQSLFLINDGASSSDCTTGGGTSKVLCVWDGASTLTAFSGGGGGGVTSINSTAGAFTFNFSAGAGSCSGTTCTFTGSGAGGGSVTSFTAPSGSWPTWLVPTVTNSTTTPSLAVASTLSLANVAAGASPTGLYDFSPATNLKVPIHAGFTAAAPGEIGYDSTNGNLHTNYVGTDLILLGTPSASLPTSGDCAKFNLIGAWWELIGTPCGGGSSGISGLTAGFIPLAGSATTLTGNSHLDDGVTTAGTLTAAEPFAVNDGTGKAGNIGLKAGTAPSAAAANTIQINAPTSVTAYSFTLPTTGPTGTLKYMNCAAIPCVWDAGGGGGGTFPPGNGIPTVSGGSAWGPTIPRVPVENFGAVGFTTLSAAVAGADQTTAIQNAINSLSSTGGVVLLQCLFYKASNTITITTSGVGISSNCPTGQPNTSGTTPAPNATIVSTSASNNIISIHGTVATTYISGNTLEHLVLLRNILPTGTAAGVFSQFICAANYNDIWSLDSIDGFYFNSTPSCNVGNFNSLMSYWGSGTPGPYTVGTALHGINIDSTNGSSMLTAIFNQTSATIGANFGTADLASTYGIFVHGTAINDLNIYKPQTAALAYGVNITYTGLTTTADSAADIHIISPIWDTCVVACLFTTGIPLTGTTLSTLTVTDANMNGKSGGTAKAFDIESSGNVSLTDSQIIGFAGGLINNSTNVIVSNNLFNLDMSTTGYAVKGSSSSHVDISHNTIYGNASNSNTMISGVSLTASNIESNQLSGFAGTGIALDSGSTLTVQASNNIDTANITTPYAASGPYFGIPWQFQQQLGLNTQYLITAASFGIQTQYKTTIAGVHNWDWLADAFGNLQFGDNTSGSQILKMGGVDSSAHGFAAVGSLQRLGFMPSFITADAATPDTALSRDSAGVMDLGNGAQGDKSGSLNLTKINGLTVIANATTTVGTTAIAANTCTSATTVTMTGVATTSTFAFSPNADVSGTTGWGSTGGLVIDAWPTANTLNYKVCNQTAASITPGASVTFNVSSR